MQVDVTVGILRIRRHWKDEKSMERYAGGRPADTQDTENHPCLHSPYSTRHAPYAKRIFFWHSFDNFLFHFHVKFKYQLAFQVISF